MSEKENAVLWTQRIFAKEGMASDVRCYREIEGNEDQEKALVSQIAEFQLREWSSHEDQSG